MKYKLNELHELTCIIASNNESVQKWNFSFFLFLESKFDGVGAMDIVQMFCKLVYCLFANNL